MVKKKTLKTLLIILSVLIVLTILASLITDKKDSIEKKEATLMEFKINDVTGLSITYGNDEVEFYKEDDTWYLEGDSSFPVNSEYVEEKLKLVKDYKATFTIEEPEKLSSYGLQSPTCIIVVTCDEETYTLNLGSYSKMDSERYFSTDDGNVYLAETDVLDSFVLSESEYILLDTLDSEIEFTKLNISYDGSSYEIIEDEEGSYCYSTEFKYYLLDNDEYLPLDSDKIEELSQNILGIDLTNYVSYNGDLGNYGLDNPSGVVSFIYTEDKEEKTLKLNYNEKNNKIYFNIDGSNIIYKVDDEDYDYLDISYDNLRSDYVINIDWDEVSEIVFDVDDLSYDVEVKNGKYNMSGDYVESNVDLSSVLDAISDITITEYVEETPEKGEEIYIKIYQDNTICSEIDLVFYKYDGSTCLVTFNSTCIGKVERKSVVSLIEALNEIVLK